MDKSSLVTIAFPVFERTKFFVEAIESAINQTIKVPIIVVDNCSSHDKFKLICEKYGERVRYYRNNENIGMFGNWNRCFDLVETDYAIIVGDDDILSPTYIEEFYNAYELNPDIDVYYTDLYFYREKNGEFVKEETHWKNIMGKHTCYDIKADSWKSSLLFPTISSIIKVDVQKKNKFETRLHTANDKLFIYTLPDDCVFYGNEKKLYLYRRHNSNDSRMIVNTLTMAHCAIFIKLQDYSNMSFFNLLTCYAKFHICLKKDPSLCNEIVNGESFYSDVYKEITSSSKLPLYILGAIFSYFILVWRFLRKKK